MESMSFLKKYPKKQIHEKYEILELKLKWRSTKPLVTVQFALFGWV